MIYYIYKVRRKQTSIRFSRSALPYRRLRCISWISWNGHRPQPSTSWVFHLVPQSTAFSRRNPYPKTAIAALLPPPPARREQLLSDFPQEKEKQPSSPFSRTSHAPLLLCCSACDPSHVPSAAHLRPVCRLPLTSPSAAFPQTKNAGPQHCAANPLTTFVKRAQKSVDFSLKKNTRRHAWLTRSCFGRKNLFIDGPHSLLPFFLPPFL